MDKKDKKDLEKSLAQMKNTKEELKKFISSYGVVLKKRIGSFLVAKQTKHLFFIKEYLKRMLIYQHSFSFQIDSRN
jgi:hypothetical protein